MTQRAVSHCFNVTCPNTPQDGAPGAWQSLTIPSERLKARDLVVVGCRPCIDALREEVEKKKR